MAAESFGPRRSSDPDLYGASGVGNDPASERVAASGQESPFAVLREALQDGAGAGDARYVYAKAWDQIDRLETALRMLWLGRNMRDPSTFTEAEFWAAHGQDTIIETIEEALRGR